jgi:acyl dehydratase
VVVAPVDAQVIGKSYAPVTYAVGREKIREYAAAVGETNPLYVDLEAARAAGHADLVAPPMFAVVYSAPAVRLAMIDPELGVDFARVVHGAQELVWGSPATRSRQPRPSRTSQSGPE